MVMAVSATKELGLSLRTTTEEAKTAAASQARGDTVSISAEGLKQAQELTSQSAAGQSDSSGSSKSNTVIEQLKKKIEQLRKEIEQIEAGNLPEEEKREKLQMKRQMLSMMESQLTEAQTEALKSAGTSKYGGTRAQGFASSLT